MDVRIYLLDLKDLKQQELLEKFLATAPLRVDEERRRKAEIIQNPHGRAVSLGAGLLLQKAVTDAGLPVCGAEKVADTGLTMDRADKAPNVGLSVDEENRDGKVDNAQKRFGGQVGVLEMVRLTPEEILAQIGKPISLTYRYGEMGKPYLVNIPLYYNLSHSGDFVLCAVSEQEIGADIQEIRKGNVMQIAERYFAEEEFQKLLECLTEAEKNRLLFEIWAKKEAFGKLSGRGIAEVISKNMLSREEIEWLPFDAPEGYAAAVCQEKKFAIS